MSRFRKILIRAGIGKGTSLLVPSCGSKCFRALAPEVCFSRLRRFFRSLFCDIAPSSESAARRLLLDARGSALLEFAIVLPLLVVFVVGIYDFSGAFNQKQKIAQAAQEGAIIAGAQPMTDLAQSASTTPTNPDSLQPVVTAIFNSLVGSGVLANANQTSGTCGPPFAPSSQTALTWVYTISGCSNNAAGASDNLVITINRGWICGVSAGTATPCPSGPPYAVGTTVQVAYPYRWTFNRVIQLLGPSSYAAAPQLSVTATVHNQM